MADTHPDAVLYIGDMSAKTGGKIPGHSSHRAGRDADLAFFTTDLWNRPVPPYPLAHFDRFGVGRKGNDVRRFDTARNWALVEALLTDPEVAVQWIFVSKGLKARLLDWALSHDRDIEIIALAVEVLKQPGDSAPHDDHFHVRIHCPAGEAGALCVERPPLRPRAPSTERPLPSDEILLKMALEGITDPVSPVPEEHNSQ